MTKHKSSDERARQILGAARACMLEKGYTATRMDDIAKRSGLSKGGVYFHFDSKRDIFRALVQREYDHSMAFIDSVVVGEGDFAVKLLALGEHFTEIFSTSENPRLMAIIIEQSLRDEETRELLDELQTNYVAKIKELLDWGVEQGQLRPTDTASVGFLLKSIVDGIQVSYAMGHEVDIPSLLTAGLQMVMQGLIEDGSETQKTSLDALRDT